MAHPPSSSDPETILVALAGPIRALLAGLDDGVSFADLIMDSLPPDPHVWAVLVRYHACNQIAPEAEDQEWYFRKLANCGLEFRLGVYRVRALRTLDDNPPHPGHNNARRQFYRQHHQYQISYDDGLSEQPSVGANLILDWEVGARRSVLLALSKPIGVWRYKGQPQIEWRKPIEFDDDQNPRFGGSPDGDIDTPPKYDGSETGEEGEAG